jgi:hypothetical protein
MRDIFESSGLTKSVANINKTTTDGIGALNKTTSGGISNINNSIVSGFNTANSKLGNVKVNNALNVSMNPNINISGNFGSAPTVSVSGNKATFRKPSAKSGGYDRGHSIASRRHGGPQMLN